MYILLNHKRNEILIFFFLNISDRIIKSNRKHIAFEFWITFFYFLRNFTTNPNLIEFVFISHQSKASLLDNVENSSVCSWEAVEDRNSVQSSSAGNLTSSVLWVPDHCVSRCTGCQTEFWLGRRKHHCRYIGIRENWKMTNFNFFRL